MMKIKISLVAGLIAVMLLSCSTENVTVDGAAKSDRLSFKSNEEFHETYRMLSKMTSREELEQWAQRKNHKTLLYSEDPAIENYSNILKTILNEDAEYALGEEIIWFHEGDLYSFSKDQAAMLSTLKGDLDKCKKIGSVKLSRLETVEGEEGRTKTISLGLGGLDARNQYEFTQQRYTPCGTSDVFGGGNRKFVHEIYDETYSYNPGPVYESYLHLRVKLEWKGRRWRPASEHREIRINVSGSAYMIPSGAGGPFSVSNAFYDCSGDVDIVIKALVGAYPFTPSWNVSMSGSIYQKVKGDYVEWNNNGTLW